MTYRAFRWFIKCLSCPVCSHIVASRVDPMHCPTCGRIPPVPRSLRP